MYHKKRTQINLPMWRVKLRSALAAYKRGELTYQQLLQFKRDTLAAVSALNPFSNTTTHCGA